MPRVKSGRAVGLWAARQSPPLSAVRLVKSLAVVVLVIVVLVIVVMVIVAMVAVVMTVVVIAVMRMPVEGGAKAQGPAGRASLQQPKAMRRRLRRAAPTPSAMADGERRG